MKKTEIKEFKCRCSAIGRIMTDPRGKNPEQAYKEALLKLQTYSDKYATLKTKDGKMGLGYIQKIEDIKKQLPALKDSCGS